MLDFNMGRVPPSVFGIGSVEQVPDLVSGFGARSAMIVADAFLKELGGTDRLVKGLSAKGIAYDLAADIAGEPKEPLVNALCQRARQCGADVVIGLGGGAALDASKLVAGIAKSALPVEDYAMAARPIPRDGLPAIAIPTTAGTGSEVTRIAVISDESGWKKWYADEELMFNQVVLDPELTLTLPSHLTAWTGIDAVTHAVEGSTGKRSSPASLLYSREALKVLSKALPQAIENGLDIEARSKVLWGAYVAGLALHNSGTHLGHNLSHAIGSLARVHHGLTTGLALEASLAWLVARPEGADNYAAIAEALGAEAKPEALPKALSKLMRKCQIPAELPAECAGLTTAALADEMKNTAHARMLGNVPCPVLDGDIQEIAGLVLQVPVAAVP